MKKNLLTLLIAGILGLSSCSEQPAIQNEIKEIRQYTRSNSNFNPKKKIDSKENSFTRFKTDSVNSGYLEKFLYNSEFFNNHYDLSKAIINILKDKEHTYRSEDSSQEMNLDKRWQIINDLSLAQNQRIYLMLKSLKDSSFLNRIGTIIEKDIQDKYSEHGGIVTISPNLKLKLKVIDSENSKDKSIENNNWYTLPEEAYIIPHLAKFHLHATKYKDSEFAGPGIQDKIIANSNIDINDEFDEFIITSLEKEKFNIDYLGGDKRISKRSIIIDLGNYQYDSTKINFK